MRGTTKRNRKWAQGEALAAEFVDSGQRQEEFCQERGIGVSTLQYWLRKMAQAEEDVDGCRRGRGFVELKVEGPGPAKTETEGDHREYELILANGRRLVMRGGFELPEVSALVSLLEARA